MNGKIDITKRLFQEGIQFFKNKKYKNAIAKWEQVLQYFPNHAQTRQWIERTRNEIAKQISIQELINKGTELYNNNELERAVEEWKKVLDIDPDNAEVENLLTEASARLELAQTDSSDIPAMDSPDVDDIAKKERDEEKLLKEGLALMYTRDYFPALRKFKNVLARRPKHTEALLYVETLKGTLAAEGILDEWLEETKQSFEAGRTEDTRVKLEILSLLEVRDPVIQRMYNEILTKDSEDSTDSTEEQVKQLLNRSLSLYEAGDTESAIDLWEKILGLDPENQQAKNYISTAREESQRKTTDHKVSNLFKDAIRFHQDGDIRKALSKIDGALKINPEHAGAVKMQRELLMSLKRKDYKSRPDLEISSQLPIPRRQNQLRNLVLMVGIPVVLILISAAIFFTYQNLQIKKSRNLMDEGVQLLQSGKEKEGLALIRNALMIYENNADAFKILGNHYYKSEDYAKAAEQFEEVKRLGEASKEDLLKLNKSLLKTMHFNRALAGFTEMAADHPEEMELFKGIGQVYMNIEKYNDAILQFQKALSLKPNDSWTKLYLGDAYIGNKQINKAVTTYQDGIKKDKKFLDFYLHLGELYYRENQLDKAVETLETPLLWAPENPKFHFSLGKIYQNEKNYSRAVESYSKALKNMPDDDPKKHQILFQKAVTHFEMGQVQRNKNEAKKLYNHAKSELDKSRDLCPNNFKLKEDYAPYFFYMGEIYLKLDFIQMAEIEYKLAIQQEPDYTEAYTSLGKLFYQLHKKENSVKNLKKSLELNPNQPEVKKLLRSMGY